MLGRVEGMSRVLQHVQGTTQPLGATPRSLPSLSTCLQAPGKRAQGRDRQAVPGESWKAGQGEGYWGSCHSNIPLET